MGVLMSVGITARAGFSFQGEATGPRATLKRLVEAIEREDPETIRACIAPRFFEGNPEIPGRLVDSFEQFENIKIQYKVASVKVADDIVSVKLNWIKTATNPMNNWSYRDVGNNVVMQFSAVEPCQLTGLQEPNLFGVSFLLPTPIVIPSPDEKRIELARQELEIAERKAQLQREGDERRKAIDAEKTARDSAKEQERKKGQDTKNTERRAGEDRKLEDAALAKKKSADAGEAALVKQAQSAPGAQGLIAPDEALSEPLVALPSGPLPLNEPNTELARQVRERADAQALALLARRKQPETPTVREGLAIPEILPAQQPPISKDLAGQRAARLKGIRDSQSAIEKMTTEPEAVTRQAKPEEAEAVALDLQDAARLAAQIKAKSDAEAVSMLANKRVEEQAQQIGKTALPEMSSEDIAAADKDKQEQQLLIRSKEDAEKRAQFVLAEIGRLEREGVARPGPGAQPKAGLSGEEREQARAKAMREAEAEVADENLRKKQAGDLKNDGLSRDDQVKAGKAAAEELKRIQEDARMAAEVKAKAEDDARRMLIERGKGDFTNRIPVVLPSEELGTSTLIVASSPGVQTQDVAESFGSNTMVTAVVGAAPEAAQATQTVDEAATGKVTLRTAPVSASDLNPMQTIKGGSQPEGPEYDFLMSQYEITNEEFVQFLNDAKANPYNGRGSSMFFDDAGNVYMNSSTNQNERLFAMTVMDFDGRQLGVVFEKGQYLVAPGKERYPVTGVSWYGAIKYCNWLTIRADYSDEDICYKEGTAPDHWHPITVTDDEWLNGFSDNERQNWIKTCAGFRLPMNNYNTATGKYNEFYLAAAWNGKENLLYGFGRNTITINDANFTAEDGHSFQGVLPVGFFDGTVRPGDFKTHPNENATSLFDLSGNVWEWSNDTPGSIEYRSLFGGGWDSGPDALKVSFRGSLSPHNTCQNVGFRLVCGIRTVPVRLAPK